MRLLCKAVVLEVGLRWCKRTPKGFYFSENLRKIPENPGINGAQRCLTSKNDTQSWQKNTRRSFFGGHTKKCLHDLCWRKFVSKIAHKTFRASLGNSGKNPSHSQKFACSSPYDERRLRIHCPLLKEERGKRSCHASILWRPCAYYSTLSLLVIVGYNVSLK